MLLVFIVLIVIFVLNGHYHLFNIDNKKWLKYTLLALLAYIVILFVSILLHVGPIGHRVWVFYNMYLNPAVPHY